MSLKVRTGSPSRGERERKRERRREKQRRKGTRWWTEILNFRCFVLVTMVVRFISVSLRRGKRNEVEKKKESNIMKSGRCEL